MHEYRTKRVLIVSDIYRSDIYRISLMDGTVTGKNGEICDTLTLESVSLLNCLTDGPVENRQVCLRLWKDQYANDSLTQAIYRLREKCKKLNIGKDCIEIRRKNCVNTMVMGNCRLEALPQSDGAQSALPADRQATPIQQQFLERLNAYEKENVGFRMPQMFLILFDCPEILQIFNGFTVEKDELHKGEPLGTFLKTQFEKEDSLYRDPTSQYRRTFAGDDRDRVQDIIRCMNSERPHIAGRNISEAALLCYTILKHYEDKSPTVWYIHHDLLTDISFNILKNSLPGRATGLAFLKHQTK